MSTVSKSSGQTAVYSTSTPSQPEESKKPAETKTEPEKAAPTTVQTNSADRAANSALAGQVRAGEIKNQLVKDQIQQSFQNRFNALSANKQEFHSLMKEVYGANYDAASAEGFRTRALKGDFNWLPK